ncbi:MAG TPA: hypothetical protein VF574_02950 [Allosphingosinicella sp.]|jgi:hypothetical protein
MPIISQPIIDLVGCSLLMRAKSAGDRGILRADTEQLLSVAIDECGDWVTDEILAEAADALSEVGLARSTKDPLGDRFYKVDAAALPGLIRKAKQELDLFEREGRDGDLDIFKKGRFPVLDAISEHPTFERYHDFGDEWLKRALKRVDADIMAHPVEPSKTDESQLRRQVRPSIEPLTEENRIQLVAELARAEQALEKAELTNVGKAQGRAFVIAARVLAESPDPPHDVIWDLIQRANNLAGIASLLVAVIALLATR